MYNITFKNGSSFELEEEYYSEDIILIRTDKNDFKIPPRLKFLYCNNILSKKLDLPSTLEVLSLVCCGIEELDVEKLISLRELYVSFNRLTKLINFPSSLKMLYCSNNHNLRFLLTEKTNLTHIISNNCSLIYITIPEKGTQLNLLHNNLIYVKSGFKITDVDKDLIYDN